MKERRSHRLTVQFTPTELEFIRQWANQHMRTETNMAMVIRALVMEGMQGRHTAGIQSEASREQSPLPRPIVAPPNPLDEAPSITAPRPKQGITAVDIEAFLH